MSYEITATRKRPQTFNDLAGQEFVSTTLRASIKSGRIAHAYLFSGPRGCGKTSTARILARSLNCEKGPTDTPCGECESCKAIARGSSLDVIEIDGASNTSVENIRQIKDEVLYPPNSSRYKIYIIDEVHMLSNSAFNALLKTIEEPPEYIIFIFATTELHKVPATIKSRCQQFSFRLFSLDVIKQLLRSAADDIKIKAEDNALLWIAREATGSMRDAYTLFDQIASFSDGEITEAKIQEKLGLVGTEKMCSMFSFFAEGNRSAALELLDNLLSSGISVEQFVQDAVSYARSLLFITSGITKESILGNSRFAFPEELTQKFDPPKLEQILSTLFDLFRNMRYSVNPRWELELVIAKLCSINNYISPSKVVKTIENFKKAIEEGKISFAKSPSSIEEQKEEVEKKNSNEQVEENSEKTQNPIQEPQQSQDLVFSETEFEEVISFDQKLKEEIINKIKKTDAVLGACLERSTEWKIELGKVIITCHSNFDAGSIMSNSAIISKLIQDATSHIYKIEAKSTCNTEIIQNNINVNHEQNENDSTEELVEKVIEKANEQKNESKIIHEEKKIDLNSNSQVAMVEEVFRGQRMGDKYGHQ